MEFDDAGPGLVRPTDGGRIRFAVRAGVLEPLPGCLEAPQAEAARLSTVG